MEEIWKGVKGSDGKYQISNFGNVRNNFRPMIPQLHHYGYYKVRLTINGIRKGYFVHRLVGIAFIDNQENKKCINHIDGNKTNNSLNNLEWVSYSENMIHAYKTKLQTDKSGVNNGRCKITEDDVVYIRISCEHDTILASRFNLSRVTIRNIRLRKLWKHIL
jgi:hypothetical protein